MRSTAAARGRSDAPARWRTVRPESVNEAVTLLSEAGGAGRPHAGGTDLMVQIREGRHSGGVIVDLARVKDLHKLEIADDRILIGAALPMTRIMENSRVASAFPGLLDAIRVVGSVQIRNRASLGGNIGNASPAADTVPMLVVLEAVAHIAGPNGERTATVESIFAGPGRTKLAPGELITGVELPIVPGSTSAYLRRTRRTSVDLAIVSSAVALTVDRTVRVAFGASGPVIERSAAVEALINEHQQTIGSGSATFPDQLLANAARVATATVRPISDVRAGEPYRRAMAGVLLSRTIRVAESRLIGGRNE